MARSEAEATAEAEAEPEPEAEAEPESEPEAEPEAEARSNEETGGRPSRPPQSSGKTLVLRWRVKLAHDVGLLVRAWQSVFIVLHFHFASAPAMNVLALSPN